MAANKIGTHRFARRTAVRIGQTFIDVKTGVFSYALEESILADTLHFTISNSARGSGLITRCCCTYTWYDGGSRRCQRLTTTSSRTLAEYIAGYTISSVSSITQTRKRIAELGDALSICITVIATIVARMCWVFRAASFSETCPSITW